MDIWTRIGNYINGTSVEETEEQKYNRERKAVKLRALSRNQRATLLSDLKKSIHELFQVVAESANNSKKSTTMESTDDAKTLILNDDMAIVTKVCEQIDRCCCHGLRTVEGEEDNLVKFFGLLKWTCARLESFHQHQMACGVDDAGSSRFSKTACELATSSLSVKLSREIRGFVACLRTANSLSNVVLDEGKSRAFIRQALNTHILNSCIKAVVNEKNHDLLASYFTEYSLFRHKEDTNEFLSMIEGLDALSFGFMVDDIRLDSPPDLLPFSAPLPKPESRYVTPPGAPLINPEDMLDGRVRLSNEDYDTNILAEKLVSHRHLSNKYNDNEGGNPLADILRKASATQAIDAAAVAVLRFLEIGLPEYDVFGAPLINVVCNPYLCGMARFDTAMGVPDVIEACICYLHRKLSTPGLFQVHLSSEHVIDLRDAIEEVGGFHKSMAIDPHEVISVLLQYIWELPEPILTEERLEAFVACGKLSDKEQKIRNLKLLVNDLPWSHKPILERLLHLFGRSIHPEFAQRSGLTASYLALLLSPLLLRGKRSYRYSELDEATFRRFPLAGHTPIRQRLPSEFYSTGSNNSIQIAAEARAHLVAKRAAEEGAAVLEMLILYQDVVMEEFRLELAQRRRLLQKKVSRLEAVRQRQSQPIDIKNKEHVLLLKKLWDGLLKPGEGPVVVEEDECEQLLKNQLGQDTIDVQTLLKSSRWKCSGFHTADPLGGFRGGGLLSLECLVHFIHEYPKKAKDIMIRNAIAGGNRYPFPVASINVMRMLTKLLMLDQPPATTSRLILHSETGIETVLEMGVSERVSRAPFWNLLDDPIAFEKLHSMAFMLLDLHWTRSGATQMGFNPVLDATRRQVGWLLEQAPKNVEEIWKCWMQVREQHAKVYSVAPIAATHSDADDELAEDMQRTLDEKAQERRKAFRLERERAQKDRLSKYMHETDQESTPNEEDLNLSTTTTTTTSRTDDMVELNAAA